MLPLPWRAWGRLWGRVSWLRSAVSCPTPQQIPVADSMCRTRAREARPFRSARSAFADFQSCPCLRESRVCTGPSASGASLGQTCRTWAPGGEAASMPAGSGQCHAIAVGVGAAGDKSGGKQGQQHVGLRACLQLQILGRRAWWRPGDVGQDDLIHPCARCQPTAEVVGGRPVHRAGIIAGQRREPLQERMHVAECRPSRQPPCYGVALGREPQPAGLCPAGMMHDDQPGVGQGLHRDGLQVSIAARGEALDGHACGREITSHFVDRGVASGGAELSVNRPDRITCGQSPDEDLHGVGHDFSETSRLSRTTDPRDCSLWGLPDNSARGEPMKGGGGVCLLPIARRSSRRHRQQVRQPAWPARCCGPGRRGHALGRPDGSALLSVRPVRISTRIGTSRRFSSNWKTPQAVNNERHGCLIGEVQERPPGNFAGRDGFIVGKPDRWEATATGLLEHGFDDARWYAHWSGSCSGVPTSCSDAGSLGVFWTSSTRR